MAEREAVADKIRGDFFEGLWGNASVAGGPRPFSDALEYVENHLVPLSQAQAQGLSYLRVLGRRPGQAARKDERYAGLIDSVLEFRSLTGDVDPIIRAIEAIALYNKFAGFSGSLVREKKV